MTYSCGLCHKEDAVHEVIPLEGGGVMLVCETCFEDIFERAYKLEEGEINEVRV
jgi:uncharacterized Zn finger protein